MVFWFPNFKLYVYITHYKVLGSARALFSSLTFEMLRLRQVKGPYCESLCELVWVDGPPDVLWTKGFSWTTSSIRIVFAHAREEARKGFGILAQKLLPETTSRAIVYSA